MEERDIWRTADLLMKQHGEDAECVAAQRADALLAEGDPPKQLRLHQGWS